MLWRRLDQPSPRLRLGRQSEAAAMGYVKERVCVCLVSLFLQICSPRASAAASGGALRVSLSSLVNLHSERFLFFGCSKMDWFSPTAHTAIRGTPESLFGDPSRNLNIRVGGRGTSQLNLHIGFFSRDPAASPSWRRSKVYLLKVLVFLLSP